MSISRISVDVFDSWPVMRVPVSSLELLLLALRSSLVTDSTMKLFLERHPVATLTDPSTVARLLVQDELLTKFQAELLLLGHPQGLSLGRYRLVELIDKGGAGQVFLAEDTQLNRKVAVKVVSVPPERIDLRQRFKRETRASAAVFHPNVVSAYDAGELGDVFFLVTEYVAGVNLHRKVFRDGALPVRLACEYCRQAALGLSALHEAGLIHRDVKPGNLVLGDDGVVKLLDLGLARFVQPTRPEDGPLTLMHNLGQSLGTPQYLAPEQHVRSDKADHRSDIFGLGGVLHYLLTGKPPRPVTSLDDTPLPAILPAAQTRPDLPRALSRYLDRLLAPDPDDRPQSAAEVAATLAAFANNSAVHESEQVSATEPRSAVRWWHFVTLAVVIALCTALPFTPWPAPQQQQQQTQPSGQPCNVAP
jgi:serine/threonine-protein kinase